MSLIRQLSSNTHSEPEDISQSSQEYLLNSKVQELHQAFTKLKTFLDQLPQQKEESFENQIITYSGKQSLLSKPQEEILKLCQKRIEKMLRNKKTKKNWNQDDIDILVWVLNKYTSLYAKKSVHSFDQADWKFVSQLIPATSWKKCMFKWLSLKKFSLLTFRWNNTESQLLSKLIKQNGKKDWKKLAEKLYVSNDSPDKVFRTPKQCRQHWNCYLNPVIKKGPWSAKQDIKLLESVLELNCMKKWSQVAKCIKGRTQNAVKNRFTLLLQKQRRATGQQNEKHLINRILIKLMHQQISDKGEMRSQQMQQIHLPNQIFEQSQVSENQDMDQLKGDQINQGKSEGGFKIDNNEVKNKRNIIIPTVVQNQQVYQQPQYFPISAQFTPYFFNIMYGTHFRMN